MASSYNIYRILSLDGGMVTSFSPRLLEQVRGFSSTLTNFITESPGLLKKRPALVSMETLPENTHSVHYFNQMSSGETFLLAASGTTIKQKDGVSWVNVMTGLTSGALVDFLTIADQVVMTNGEEGLAIWDGTTLETSVGAEKATARTFLLFENNDLRFTAKTAGEAGNNIRVRYINHDTADTSATCTTSGTGTTDDPYYITINLRWVDAEYGLKDITTTANNVKSLIDAHGTASTLIEVALVAGSDGTKEVLEMSEIPLVGGYDAVTGKYLIEYRLRGVLAGDPDQPSLLQISHTGDPYWWSPNKIGSNAVTAFVSPDDGEGISGLCSMGDGGVLIGKPHSLYGLFGYKRENFVIDKLDPNIGVASHRSMAFARPHAYFVSYEGIFRIQPGGIPGNMTEPIQTIFDEEVDHSRLDESVGFIYQRQYIVSLPGFEGAWVILCFHIDRERWSRWDEPAGLLDTLLMHEDTVSNVYVVMDGRTSLARLTKGVFNDALPGEVPVASVYESLELDADLPQVDKDIGDLYVILQGQGSEGIVNIDVYFNWDEEPSISIDKLCQSVSRGQQLVIRVPVGKTARFMRVRLSHTTAEQFTPMALFYTYQEKEVL